MSDNTMKPLYRSKRTYMIVRHTVNGTIILFGAGALATAVLLIVAS